MGRAVSIDGAVTPPEQAKVSVYDRAFLYGDGVFETLRTYRGIPFALDAHLDRLEASARAIGIELPVPKVELAGEISDAVRVADNPESYARVMLSRGVGKLGLDPSGATSPLRVILVEPLAPPPASTYREGVSVITVRADRAADAAPGAKVMNYLASMLALQKAKAAGAAEALLLSPEGHVLEGTTSNFFLVLGGELLTPPEGSILAGITRAHVLDAARSLAIPTVLGAIGSNDLEAASEAFFTSSLREIVPVVRVDDRAIGAGKPGPVTRLLHRRFRERAGLGDEPPPWE